MTAKKDYRSDSVEREIHAAQPLRQRAAKKAAAVQTQDPQTLSADEAKRLLHELSVHQVELEMQNDELCRAQHELEASRARYFDLYDLAPVGYFTLSRQGLILEANLTAATLLGTARGVLANQPLTHFILPDDRDSYYRRLKQLFETGEPQVCDLRMVRPGGAQFWVRLDATVAQDGQTGAPECRVSLSDITASRQAEAALRRTRESLEMRVTERTSELSRANRLLRDQIAEREHAEAALRESEERFRLALDATSDGLWEWRVPTGEKYCSPAYFHMLGYEPGELAYSNQTLVDLIHADDRENVLAITQDCIDNRREAFAVEFRARSKSGQWRWILRRGKAVRRDAGGKTLLMTGTHVDITESKLAGERLDTLRAELSHASRLAALGALAGGIAHEINQPLSIVAIWAEVAAREIRQEWAAGGQEAIRALDRIAGAMERAGRIVERMKSFTRKSGPRVTTVALAEAIDEVRPLVEHNLRMSGTALDVEVNPAAAAVLADRIQLQQVLLNLIRNAVQAMDNTDPQLRRLSIRGEARGDAFAVAVGDAGCGIPPADLELVFSPFHSTKAEGLGLGLSICRTIVEELGGRIWAAANADRGATITFTLPIGKEVPNRGTQNDDLHCR